MPPTKVKHLSRGSQKLFRTGRPPSIVMSSRAELLAKGLCVVCQSEAFTMIERPLGPRCIALFGCADGKAFKGMRREMHLR